MIFAIHWFLRCMLLKPKKVFNEIKSITNRLKCVLGFLVNTTWDLHSIEAHGMPSQCALKSFAHTMTITMIGRCSSYQTIAFHKSCVQLFPRYREYFMLVNGKCSDRLVHSLNMLLLWIHSFFLYFSGLHQQKENCNPDRAISIVRNFLRNTSSKLFTKKLRATNLKLIWPTERKGPLKPNGGWSDIRDHNLCLSYTASRQMKGQNV